MTATPTMMPMLSRGKHRKPRRGACFMELASYLAGEPWSDHPACTDPALAQLARLVNDATSDAARPQLASMIPSVIGTTDVGGRFPEEIALLAAIHALPIASQAHQRGLGVGLLRMLGEVGDYPFHARDPWPARARTVLDEHPAVTSWSRRFLESTKVQPRRASVATPSTVIAVSAIAEACVPDPETHLRNLLGEAIDWARRCGGPGAAPVPTLEPHHWVGVVRAS